MSGGGDQHDNQECSSPPSHLLEVTIISAQDLHPATCRMATYASAWVNSEHKVYTQVDRIGRTNPSWNDKFVFRINDAFLHSDTSSVTINIFATTTFRRHPIVGTARVVLSSLNPSPSTRFVALQLRRPVSLRPQGIINVGVALLDEYIHNMPLDPAFVLRDMASASNRSLESTRDHSSKGSESTRGNGSGEEWKLERKKSVKVGNWVVEQEAAQLESKLEKWRVELAPIEEKPKHHMRSLSLTFPCLCSGGSEKGCTEAHSSF